MELVWWSGAVVFLALCALCSRVLARHPERRRQAAISRALLRVALGLALVVLVVLLALLLGGVPD